MVYDFDEVVDRRGSGAIKTDGLLRYYGREDLTPLWIADMDFRTPDFIVEALRGRLSHEIYGYTRPTESYWNSIMGWEKSLHGWEFSRKEVTYIPGIVRGIGFVLRCFLQPGDTVLINSPVYPPFINLPTACGYKIVHSPLIDDGRTYQMDFEGLEATCAGCRPKVFILSNPHNPAGRVWSREDLARIADICSRYGVLVISDEIHADMALFGNVHTPFQMASDTAREISIAFAAPTKTFNIAGLVSSFAVVYNPELRERFFGWLEACELDSPLFLSAIATEAAFTKGADWRRQMLSYVEGNVEFVIDYLKANIPAIRPMKPQASFLVWLDCRGLGLDHDGLIDLFVDKARLALNDGATFGREGSGFMRFNVASPRSVLAESLERLKKAVESL